jgi:23S rRNA (uracil1939-C5)-methyltransferase
MRKGDVFTLKIASLAPGGEAVSKDLGFPVFINRGCAGDTVEAKFYDVRKGFAKASILQVLQPSSWRQEAPCKLFKVCGGCQWQHINYEGQLLFKQDIVKQSLKHVGGMTPEFVDAVVEPTLGASDPLYYRNKVQFPVDRPRDSTRILAGYYKEGSHELVNIKHCPVQPSILDNILDVAKLVCEHYNFSTYDEKTGQGFLRHINMRISKANNHVLLTLVLNTKTPNLEQMQLVAKDIMDQAPDVKGVFVNLNAKAGNKIYGDKTLRVRGNEYIVERLTSKREDAPEKLKQGLEFRLSPSSFFQVNTEQAERLLDEILACLNNKPTKRDLAIDAYAGVGTMASWLATIFNKVIAVEEYPSSVSDGKINLELNGLDNVEFLESRVEDALPALKEQGHKVDLVLLDPPRKGISPEAMAGVLGLGAKEIIYVSCNPVTLARDLKILSENGYQLLRLKPVDMFPQTYHVESVSHLILK